MKTKIAAVILLFATVGPVLALELDDAMQVWKRSPNALRVKVLADPAVATQVNGNQVDVLTCMNQVSDQKTLTETKVKDMIVTCAKAK